MSNMEYHKGTVRKRFEKQVSFAEGVKILKDEFHIEDIDIENEYMYSDLVHYINKEFYVIDNHSEFDPERLFDTTLNSDNTISFTVGFYNGGASLREVVELILKRNKN